MYGSRFGWGGYPRGYLGAGIGYPYQGFLSYGYGYGGFGGYGYPGYGGYGYGYPYPYAPF